MEIVIDYYEKKIKLTLREDLDLFDLMDEIKGLLAMLGYHPDSIAEYFNDFEVSKQGWIFQYENRLKQRDITSEEILCRENLRRKRPIKMNTVFRAFNGAGFSYKK